MDEKNLSSGVQELIDRLREEGIAKGQEMADNLIRDAKQQAIQIVELARQEADDIRSSAEKDADRFRNKGEGALFMAARDTTLELKANLTSRFSRRIKDMIGETMRDEEFLKRIVLEIAGNFREMIEDEEEIDILLPADIIGLDELRRSPEKVKEGALGQFVLATAENMFREGVTIKQGNQNNGIRIYLVKRKLHIDIDEATVSEILMRHLLPRFRALLEGSIQ